jgi:acetyltransferase-like isoleucine patch superfamily enzyme
MSSHYIQDVSPQRHDRTPTASQQLEAGKVRPIGVEDGDRSVSQYMTSPTGVGPNRGTWSKRSWPGAGHPAAYLSEHMTKSDYRDVPPIHELPREGQSKADYHVVPSIRELSQHGVHPKPGMPIFQGGVDQRPPHPSNIDTNSPQAQARMALSIEHQLSTRPGPAEETERDKMIRGELYRPFDVQLVEDRDRCKIALWRFNNACNPHSGVSAKEQNRLLKEVLIPPSVTNSPSGSPSNRPAGSIGQGAIVEAPFKCHYGYNIHIGEDVMISENSSLVDDCPITIGAHTWIGPNVTILGSMAHANMQERKGSQSRYQGRPVTIEEDCYVGANCTIYPGVRLRRGAYVAPGEVVKSDIVAYGFQGLKPSYM